MSTVLDLVILVTSLGYVSFAPFTKVEESFNLHATHDVLAYGVRSANLHKYDHFVFPGAVPRTFIGSVVLAWMTQFCLRVGSWFGIFSDKFDVQVLLRMVLASMNAVGLCMLRRAVSRRFGRPTGVMFVLLSITQFHLPFWMGRTLPNMFALIPANVALYLLIDRAPNSTRPSQSSVHWAIALLTFATVVFRSELLLLVGPLALQAILRYTSLYSVVKTGLIAGSLSVALTVVVDSYFWQHWPLWPELYGVYFNVVQGKSSDWGVSPFHAYLSSYLPRLLLSSLPLSLFGLLTDSRIRSLLTPYLAFVFLISGLAHKEWRFVIYVVPAFNIAAARGAAWLTSRRKGSLFGRLAFLAVAALLAGNCAVTFLLARSSFANYPGGSALNAFNQLFASEETVHVHISNLAAQTGASLFLHTRAPPLLTFLSGNGTQPTAAWVYDKTENLSVDALTHAKDVTHLIAEAAALSPTDAKGWVPVAVVDGFDGWRMNKPRDVLRVLQEEGLAEGLRALGGFLEMVRAEKLVILKRR
ncbi:Alg9-like mannosyltransferase family-domain-containing protein [Daedaleopsis nitida]|nr:Alg9-like mannosyltransferase family-domain-containing protein [Daedaleopsis nitida]